VSEPLDATISYPGGLRARWRWGGSGSGPQVFALTEAAGELRDFGSLVSPDPDALCRAGDFHHLAENGAQTNHRRQEAQRTANSALDGVHHIQRAHPHHRADEKARQQQREERVKLQLNDG